MDFLAAGTIVQPFRHQVAAVAGGVNQQILRPRLDPPFEQSLEFAVVDFRFVEGKIVAEENEAVRVGAQQFGDGRQLKEVFLAHLDQAQAGAGEFAEQPLDRRRFAGAPGAPEEHVVGRQAVDELAGVLAQADQDRVDAEQIGMVGEIGVDDGMQVAALVLLLPAPGDDAFEQGRVELVFRQLAGQKFLAEVHQVFHTVEQVAPIDIDGIGIEIHGGDFLFGWDRI